MKNKINLAILITLLAIGTAAIIAGCGKQLISSPSTSTGNYTLTGKIGTVTTSGLGSLAPTTVTHIVAIGADNNKTLITPEADGTFSASVNSGQPYVLGFYNKTGSTITLLGYLKKSDYDWDSLPLISPADAATDLGTIEINTVSVEATPSINMTSLISEMNMDTGTANLYGKLDDSLAALANIDFDSNGQFDFNENKNYLFQSFIGMYESGNPVTGEINSMLDGYNDTYKPVPSFYQMYFSSTGGSDTRAVGTSATLTAPSAIGGSLTQTASTGAASGGGWTLFFPLATTPESAPAGTYTVAIGSTTYTIKNFKSSSVVAKGSNNNIVYPVFNLVSNESTGKLTTVKYLWKKLVNGAIATAEAAEVRTAINYAAGNTSFLTQNPFISFFSDANNLYTSTGNTGLFTLDIDSSEVSVSGLNISRSDIHHIQAGYELTSKVICKFDLY